MSTNTQYLNDKKYTYSYFSHKNVCRLCWKISKGGVSIESDALLAQFIAENLGISVKGHILQTVCCLCADTVYSFINYKKFCLEADQKLTNILAAGRLKKKLKVEHISIETLTNKVKVKTEKKVRKMKAESTEPVEREPELLSPLKGNDNDDIQEPKTDIKQKKVNKYRCQVCGEIYTNYKEYNEHRYKNHPDHNKFVCEICGRILYTRYAFTNHGYRHSNEKIKCPHCDKSFTLRDNLKAHIRRTHLRERKHACHMCPLRCFNTQHLKTHLKTHFGIKSFVCELCPKKFSTKISLQKHVKLQHEGLTGQNKCTYCTSQYNDIEGLRKHMLKIHGKKIKACKGSFYVVDESNKRGECSKENSQDARLVEGSGVTEMMVDSSQMQVNEDWR